MFFSIKNVDVGGGGGGLRGLQTLLPPAPPPMVETVFNLILERWAIFTMMPFFIASNVHFVFDGLSGTFI